MSKKVVRMILPMQATLIITIVYRWVVIASTGAMALVFS